MYTPEDLERFLRTHHLPGEVLRLAQPTPTVEAAARAVGVSPQQIVKSVLFLVDGQPVLAVACGTAHVERRAIAVRCGVGRKRVRLADAEAVLRHTGYPVGAVPPFGFPQPIPTFIDPAVMAQSVVFAGGGAENALLRIAPEHIRRITGGEVLPLQPATPSS